MSKQIYLIGSLRNETIPKIGVHLREQTGLEVFDDWFSPGPEADDYWKRYEESRGRTYQEALKGWAGKHVFEFDKHHIDNSDIGVLIMPAGKSGHMELGYMIGCGKPCYVLMDTQDRWDVMYQFATDVLFDMDELVAALKTHSPSLKGKVKVAKK